MSISKEIIQNVINIYDDTSHPNKKCQNIKEEWMKYCFFTSYKIFILKYKIQDTEIIFNLNMIVNF